MTSKFVESAKFVRTNPETLDVVSIHQLRSVSTGMVAYNVCCHEHEGHRTTTIVNELWGDNNEAMDRFHELADQYECSEQLD